MSFRIDPQEMRERDAARFAEAVRELQQRDVKNIRLAHAIFECRLIALGKDPAEIRALLVEHAI